MLQLCRVEVPDSGGNTARVLRLGRIFRVFWSKYQTNRLEALHLAAAGGHLGVVHALLSRQVETLSIFLVSFFFLQFVAVFFDPVNLCKFGFLTPLSITGTIGGFAESAKRSQ